MRALPTLLVLIAGTSTTAGCDLFGVGRTTGLTDDLITLCNVAADVAPSPLADTPGRSK